MTIPLGDRLLDLCSGAHELVLAAPYIKAPALERVLLCLDAGALLVVITRWTPHDLACGVSDIRCRSMVTEFGGSFRLHPNLHAKYYRIDKDVLVGSANVTSTAMGWARRSNTEILCTPGPDFDAANFETFMVAQSRELSKLEFSCWRQVAHISMTDSSGSPTVEVAELDDWFPKTRDFANLGRAYDRRLESIASRDEQQRALSDLQALCLPSGLSTTEFRGWVTACILGAPFTQMAIEIREASPAAAAQQVAQEWGLSVTEARRALEAMHSWFVSLDIGDLVF